MQVVNNSGLKPLGRAVLVQMYQPEQKKGVIHIPELVQEKSGIADSRAIIVELGELAWNDEGGWEPILGGLLRRWVQRPRAKVGDKVLVTKFSGFMAKGTLDGKLYRLVNDRDIFCGIVQEMETADMTNQKVANG